MSVRRQKMRSLLTAFGVFWGIFMLVVLIGAGMGLNEGIVGSIKSIPTNSILLITGETSVAWHGFARGRKWTMDNQDNVAVRKVLAGKYSSVASVKFAPDLMRTASAPEHQSQFMVAGVTPSYYSAMPHKLVQGRYVNYIDIMEERKVCVIGQVVADQLFPEEKEVVDRTIVIDNVPYTIVGVCKNPNRSISIGLDPENSILLPLVTMQLSYNVPDRIDITVIILKDQFPAQDYTAAIAEVVKERHNISPDDQTALDVVDLSAILKQYDNLFKGLDILIWLVGLGTLLAGLIGISNIMMVTIKERTQEIGVRRALGALPETIIKQIMCESLTLTLGSGFVGLFCGTWALSALRSLIGSQEGSMFQNPYMPFAPAIACLFILVLGGLFAGWMPARRAMKIKAIEALREE